VRAFDHRHARDARTWNVPRSGRSLHMVYFVNAGGTTIERAVNESRSKEPDVITHSLSAGS
jgi:hypothetical protein